VTTILARSQGITQVDIRAGNHSLRSDEPVEFGGSDTGPTPYDLLLASLASCKAITMRMYAQRKGWALQEVEISMSTRKVHAKDCEDCESDPEARVDIIETEIRLTGDLDQEQRKRIFEISEKCPVHRTLISETKIRTTLVN
jgi:putative redox protein